MHVEIIVLRLLHTGRIAVALLCMSVFHGLVFVSDKLPHSRYDRTNLYACVFPNNYCLITLQ